MRGQGRSDRDRRDQGGPDCRGRGRGRSGQGCFHQVRGHGPKVVACRSWCCRRDRGRVRGRRCSRGRGCHRGMSCTSSCVIVVNIVAVVIVLAYLLLQSAIPSKS